MDYVWLHYVSQLSNNSCCGQEGNTIMTWWKENVFTLLSVIHSITAHQNKYKHTNRNYSWAQALGKEHTTRISRTDDVTSVPPHISIKPRYNCKPIIDPTISPKFHYPSPLKSKTKCWIWTEAACFLFSPMINFQNKACIFIEILLLREISGSCNGYWQCRFHLSSSPGSHVRNTDGRILKHLICFPVTLSFIKIYSLIPRT
jgi:hypothetical protein